MKVFVDNSELFSISDIQKKVICNDVPKEILDEDLKRRIQWIINHKYEHALQKLKNEWIPKLKARGVQNLPLDDEMFAALVFSQPDYKDFSSRIAEQQ